MRRGAALVPIVLLIASALLAACGGDKASPPVDGASDSPPAAPVEPTSVPFPSLLSLTPVAPPRPATPADALLGGTPNRRAAALVREELKTAGLDIPGIEVHVLPVSGTHEELLVVEIDAAAAQNAGVDPEETGDPTVLFKALAVLQNSEIANVTRVVINVHSQDAGAPSIVTLVLPMGVIADAALGIENSEDMLEQLLFEIRPEAGP